ncbi:GrpB family protein [Gottfriedia acidiceleris]|uniref:GrpB family protein n=1 Tax=Gottfriedia acidiceleris TaxID=371036 RepID=UPI00101D6197|nr:GrpB family protein [Gottfriedia acidiceleris]
MEQVSFSNNPFLFVKAEKSFLIHRKLIKALLPEADVQHVGSTAIPNSLTKGDLDIQVRVIPEQFEKAVKALASVFELNEGSIKTDLFRAFKNDSIDSPIGLQLTIIDSDFDFFWKFRDLLLLNDEYRVEYDNLKRRFEGRGMDEYRECKNKFFEKLMHSPEYKKI